MPRPCGPILVVDDDDALLQCVSALLEEDGFVVLAARTGEEALALARSASPRAAVVDICLPGLSGYEVCRVLKQEKVTLPVLFISGERTESFDRVAGLLIGADDYLVKPFAPDELLARLRALLRRAPADESHGLTRREAEVLGCLSEGLGHSAIGERLVISPKTVGTHIEHIYEKLGVHSRAQAVAAAYGHGLLTQS
ncbi:MAG: response regulator transcription factor [Actinomycetota bacterium]|nr:response regulator transcription factor [Actinomycetota bacterium]